MALEAGAKGRNVRFLSGAKTVISPHCGMVGLLLQVQTTDVYVNFLSTTITV
jgi:hypothetical protein